MIFFRIGKRRVLGTNLRLIFMPTILNLFLVVLFVVLLRNGYYRISSQLEEFDQTRQREQQLEQKLTSLQQVNHNIIERSDRVLILLPNQNPALWMVAQLKSLAQERSVTINRIELTKQTRTEDNLEDVTMQVTVLVDNIDTLTSFIRTIENLAPVSTVDEAIIQEDREEGQLVSQISISLYWADLPEKIPPITQPIDELTPQELALLNSLSNYKFPEFTNLSPRRSPDRNNPFQ